MELAVNVMAGALVGLCLVLTWAATNQYRTENSRFRRGLLKSADGVDKLLQQIKDKLQEVDKVLRERVPELAHKIAKATIVESNHKREIAQSKQAIELSAVGFDTRIRVLEAVGLVRGDVIVNLEQLKLNQVETLQRLGYRIPKAGEFPLHPQHGQMRPANAVREIETRISQQVKEGRREEKRLTEQMTTEVKDTVVPPPSRDNLEELTPLRERWAGALKKVVRRGSRNKAGSAETRQLPSQTRRARKGG